MRLPRRHDLAEQHPVVGLVGLGSDDLEVEALCGVAARQLFVSLNTVRTHTKKIYAKLGVNSRRSAVRRAEELDLFAARSGPVGGSPP